MAYQSEVPQGSVHNWILARLPGADYRRLAPHLEMVSLTTGEVLYRPGKPIRYVYFPESAVISQLATLEDGSTAEVGVVGREGMLGIRLLFGAETAPHQATLQITGGAVRAKAEPLEEMIRSRGPLHTLLLGFAQALLAQVRQSAVCNAHHSVRRRLARWLLVMSDEAASDELRLTHEIIADMMGTRRAGVTDALGEFREEGLVSLRRGRVIVLDREGLEGVSCECYRAVKREYDRLLGHES